MSDAQLKHFENILRNWKAELMKEVDRTVHHMQDDAANFPDPNDRATQESEFSLELRTATAGRPRTTATTTVPTSTLATPHADTQPSRRSATN